MPKLVHFIKVSDWIPFSWDVLDDEWIVGGNHIFFWIYYSVLYTARRLQGKSVPNLIRAAHKKLYKSIRNYSLQIAISKDKLLLGFRENNVWERVDKSRFHSASKFKWRILRCCVFNRQKFETLGKKKLSRLNLFIKKKLLKCNYNKCVLLANISIFS